MAERREIGYAWRDRSATFTEHDALAQAVQQVINQVVTLPPGSTLLESAKITFLGTVEGVKDADPTAPDQQYLLSAVYAVPAEGEYL